MSLTKSLICSMLLASTSLVLGDSSNPGQLTVDNGQAQSQAGNGADDSLLDSVSASIVQNPNGQLNNANSEPFKVPANAQTWYPFLTKFNTPTVTAQNGEVVEVLDYVSIVKSYSNKDFDRWDGCEAKYMSYVPPEREQNSDPRYQAYENSFKFQHQSIYFPVGYNWFIGFMINNANQNPINQLTQDNNWDYVDVMQNVSFHINQEYNIYRRDKLNSMSQEQFDNEDIDWINLPNVKDIISWLETYISTVISIQQMQHTQQDKPNYPGQTFDTFGLIQNANGWGNGFDQFSHIFNVVPLGHMCTRYVHLYSSDFLRKARVSIMASTTALYNVLNGFGWGEQFSSVQWIMRVVGAITHANFLSLSERELKNRGEWSGSDEVSTDRENGKWSTDDAISLASTLLEIFNGRLYAYGINEYNSAYYSLTMEYLSIAMINAPNEDCYNKIEFIYKQYWYDIGTNFFPAGGAMSGALARHYDLLSGLSDLDKLDIRQYVDVLFQPACGLGGDNTCATQEVVNSPSSVFGYNFNRLCLASMQIAGMGYLPTNIMIQHLVDMPYRTVEQRFNKGKGQERFNFISPYYQIGFGGENIAHTYANSLIAARLPGSPIKALPVPQQDANTEAYVRVMLDSSDNPFTPSGNGIVAEGVQITSRQLVAQYQGLQLITQLAVPDADSGKSLSTNLLIPLAVQGLYADGYRMPTSVGSSVALPMNSIFAVNNNGSSIAIRVLYAETSSQLQNATKPTKTASQTAGAGNQQYTYMWQVDDESYKNGMGRLIVHYKSGGDSTSGPFHLALALLGGHTEDWSTTQALQNTLASAQFSQSFQDEAPKDQYTQYQRKWSSQLILDGAQLNVDRTDFRTTWENDKTFGAGDGVLMTFPWGWTDGSVSRRVNNQEMLQYQDGTDNAFRTNKVEEGSFYQPHLNADGQGKKADPSTFQGQPNDASEPVDLQAVDQAYTTQQKQQTIKIVLIAVFASIGAIAALTAIVCLCTRYHKQHKAKQASAQFFDWNNRENQKKKNASPNIIIAAPTFRMPFLGRRSSESISNDSNLSRVSSNSSQSPPHSAAPELSTITQTTQPSFNRAESMV